jgi:hypothetical protein
MHVETGQRRGSSVLTASGREFLGMGFIKIRKKIPAGAG